MSRYRLTRRARDDIRAIWTFMGVQRGNPDAAHKQIESLYDRIRLLATQPLMGELRDDLRPGLRIFSAGRYVILYYPMKDGVQIVGIIHGSRDIESLFRRGER